MVTKANNFMHLTGENARFLLFNQMVVLRSELADQSTASK
jgi:hypothetical protein